MRHTTLMRLVAMLLGLMVPAAASAGKANVVLSDSKVALTQISDTAWTLAKTGAVDTTASSVTWTITATQGATAGGHLVITGYIAVSNIGTGGATIGNIVVNLQTKVHGSGWVTQSSDIADATHGDAATTAHVVAQATTENQATFTENAASGHLSFMDKKKNTAFSLVPKLTIPAGKTVHLLFAASFNNSVLGLAAGTATREEILVTFGNHAAGGPKLTDQNVDIDGNGVIDPDEAKVRTVSVLIEKPVPATQAANTAVTLSDTAADIATTGTVLFTNPVITLGSTTGTATVTYDGGASGGAITNCAHATGSGVTVTVGQFQLPLVAPVKLDACNTQTIGPFVCTPGAVGCGWKQGDLTTFDETTWTTDGATLLTNNYNAVYLASGDILVVGAPDPGFSMSFTGADAVLEYLPQADVPGVLDSDSTDPTSTASGTFGGDVTALKLDVDFSDRNLEPGSSGLKLGDLTFCGLAQADLNGISVRQLLALLNNVLGGGPTPDSVTDLDSVASSVTSAFDGGAPTDFAQQHLVNGACK